MSRRESPTPPRDPASTAPPRPRPPGWGTPDELPADHAASAIFAHPSDASSLLWQNLTSEGGLMPHLVRTSAKLPGRFGPSALGKSHQPTNEPPERRLRGLEAFRGGRRGVPFRHLSLE